MLRADRPQCAIQGSTSSVLTITASGIYLTGTACLTKNSFNEDKCQAQIDALYECCNAFYQERGEQGQTPSCPKASLLRLKMKQRAQGN